jgi:hypothetical protein
MFGVFTDDELAMLQHKRNEFPRAAAVGRGGQFQPWKNGEMVGIGSRMPSGGRPGDTYTVYQGMEIVDDVNHIKKVFQHAKVSTFHEPINVSCLVMPRTNISVSKW